LPYKKKSFCNGPALSGDEGPSKSGEKIFSLSFFLDKKETKNQGSKIPAARAEATSFAANPHALLRNVITLKYNFN